MSTDIYLLEERHLLIERPTEFVEIVKSECKIEKVTVVWDLDALEDYLSRPSTTSATKSTASSTESNTKLTNVPFFTTSEPQTSQASPASTTHSPTSSNPQPTDSSPNLGPGANPGDGQTTVAPNVPQPTESNTALPQPSTTAVPNVKHEDTHHNTPIIAGAAAGGTALLAALFGTVFYLLRRRKRSRSQASTPPNWDPSHGTHGKPTLPSVDRGSTLEAAGLADVTTRGENTTKPTIPDRYASYTARNIHQAQTRHAHGLSAAPLMQHQHSNHSMTKQHSITSRQQMANNSNHHVQQPHHLAAHYQPIGHPDVPAMRFNDSPYPEIATRSPPPISPPTTLHTMPSWHSPSPPGASESYNENIGSPVSELGRMGTQPVMRMNVAGGIIELGSTGAMPRVHGVGAAELGDGGRPNTGYAEIGGGERGRGYAEMDGTQARPRYYAGNGGQQVGGGVSQNF